MKATRSAKGRAPAEPMPSIPRVEKCSTSRHNPPSIIPQKRKALDIGSLAKSKVTKGTSSKGKQSQHDERERTVLERVRADSSEINPIVGSIKSRNILFPKWFDSKDQKLLELFPEFLAVMEAKGRIDCISTHKRY